EMNLRLEILLPLLVLSMVVSCGGKNITLGYRIVPLTCEYILLEAKIYQRWCMGTYPAMAISKYHDRLIEAGEPYALYLPISQDSILVLHKKSPLQKCRNLIFKDSNTFICMDGNRNETILVNEANIYCITFHTKIPDDLMNECLRENLFQHDNRYPVEVIKTRRSVLHYTFAEEGAQSLKIPLLLPSLTFLLQFF
ncbi:hypothetical protein KR059_006021, partial [Drosophila kikkawai]